MFPDRKKMKGTMSLNHHGEGASRAPGGLVTREQPLLSDRAPRRDRGFWAAMGGGPRPSQAWFAQLPVSP